jgi:polysaccharide export outer membrane protein
MIRSAKPSQVAAVILAMVSLSACQSLPTAGPTYDQVRDLKPENNKLGVHLVPLTPLVVQSLREHPVVATSIINRLGSSRAVDLLGPGDILNISIYEAGNALFGAHHTADADTNGGPTAEGSTAETLPKVQVDRDGMIMVPYGGEIHVAGLTTTAVQRIIESRLGSKTAQPQVLVSTTNNGSNIAYVSGDVRSPGRYALSLAHERLLDMVALAGGPTHSPQDTQVKVNRGGREATTSLQRIQTLPAENITVQPLDRIQVDYLPRSYLAFGATGKVEQVHFDAATVSLAEAIARVGGLDDNRANPEAVFLFRFESAQDARTIGLVPTTPDEPAVIPGAMPAGTPVIYQVNMRDPQSFFAIQQFAMKDKDLLYIANAPTVQLYKFLELIYTFATPAITAKAVTN